jgi:RNA-directed DNA polymerase
MACPTLAQHLDVALRAAAVRRLTPHSAPGVDRVTWRLDTEHLESPLATFHEQRVNDPSCPQPVGRRLLPKRNGTRRPLGLPAVEDTSVAKAVARLLEALSAQECSDVSHGLRPGRNPPQALPEVRQGLRGSRMRQVIDCDISAFFDTLPHDPL